MKYKIPQKDQEKPTENKATLVIGAAPNMPYNAKRSGFCCLQTDIDANGKPTSIKTTFCSEKKFRKPTLLAAKYWQFNPAIKNGTPIRITDQSHIMTFILTDERGRAIQNKRKQLRIKDGRAIFVKDEVCTGIDIS